MKNAYAIQRQNDVVSVVRKASKEVVMEWDDSAHVNYPEDLTWNRSISSVFWSGYDEAAKQRKENIQARITKLEKDFGYLLEVPAMNIEVNAPGALQQLATTSQLRGLYYALGEKYPGYAADSPKKKGE